MTATMTARGFQKDERGAIMVIGVFLSLLLIAGLWYVIGIGDAMLWRDRSQEAADAIAFTSAALHARGMNFIAFLNILMLMITSLYLIMCMVRTILDMILWVTGDPTPILCVPATTVHTEGHSIVGLPAEINKFFGGSDEGFLGGISGALETIADLISNVDNAAARDLILAQINCPVPLIGAAVCCVTHMHKLQDIAKPVGKAYAFLETKVIVPYQKTVMGKGMPAMAKAQRFTARAMPYVGLGVGAYVGYTYAEKMMKGGDDQHRFGLALSPSMFNDIKRPGEVKRLKNMKSCDEPGATKPCYIKFEGNGCGPTLCNDGEVSRSGPYLNGTSAPNATCCEKGSPNCKTNGICSSHGNMNPDQSGLYETVNTANTKDCRVGLPVEHEYMNELCVKAVSYVAEWIVDLLSKIPGVGSFLNISFFGLSPMSLINKIISIVAGQFKTAYCMQDDVFSAGHSKSGYEKVWPDKKDFWEMDDDKYCKLGPMKMVDYAKNGNDYMQVYGIVANQNYNAVKGEYGDGKYGSYEKVQLGVGPQEWSNYDDGSFSLGLGGQGPLFYLAEAEFYFDCDAVWDDNSCNGGDRATYQMNWRTRLRRVRKPEWLQEITGQVPGVVNTALQWVANNQGQIQQVALGWFGTDVQGMLTQIENLADLTSPNATGKMIH